MKTADFFITLLVTYPTLDVHTPVMLVSSQ